MEKWIYAGDKRKRMGRKKKNLLVPENPERPNGRKKERKMEGKKTEKMMRKQ